MDFKCEVNVGCYYLYPALCLLFKKPGLEKMNYWQGSTLLASTTSLLPEQTP